jgi:hypothetical protein
MTGPPALVIRHAITPDDPYGPWPPSGNDWVEVRRLPKGFTLFRSIEIACPELPSPSGAQHHYFGGGEQRR